jgi:hypothetical protein
MRHSVGRSVAEDQLEDAFLEVRRKDGVERVELTGAQVTLGRASENTVCFPEDNMVSRRHAVLTAVANGWSLSDSGSVNGTHVNGEKLTGERVLKPGDRITMGTSRWMYRSDTATPPPIPAVSAPSPGHGRQQGHGFVTGIARSVQKRRGANGSEELVFQVEPDDGPGHRPRSVQVQLSPYRGGRVGEGEEVEVTGSWAAGTLRARTIFNFETGAELTSGPRWEYIALVSLALLLLALLIVIYGMIQGL